jgi:hypothetical protein
MKFSVNHLSFVLRGAECRGGHSAKTENRNRGGHSAKTEPFEGKEIPLTKGKIQIQTEGAEVYYRNIQWQPITEIIL